MLLPPLYDDQRIHLQRLAMMLMLGSAAMLPIAAPSSAVASARDQTAIAKLSVPSVPGRLTFPEVVIKRDPFQADDRYVDSSDTAGPMSVGQTDDIGVVLPPNAGALETPPVAMPSGGGATLVRAIITGGAGRALIDIGGTVQVFTVGDRIGDQRIRSIREDGVTLSDGTTLPLSGEK